MEAKLVDALPADEGWQFEPKWDGFRCLAFRDGARGRAAGQGGQAARRAISRRSSAALRRCRQRASCSTASWSFRSATCCRSMRCRCGCIPAESRIAQARRRDAGAADAVRSAWRRRRPGAARRAAGRAARGAGALLRERAASAGSAAVALSPRDRATAAWRWLERGRRRARRRRRQAPRRALSARRAGDAQGQAAAHGRLRGRRLPLCAPRGKEVGSLLLGLYDDAGRLDHVGFTSAIPAEDGRR